MDKQVRTGVAIWWLVVVVLVCVLIPFPQMVAPEWTVTTLDSTHKPIPGVTVREVWEQYSLEKTSHEEDRLTDDKGQVQLPRRMLRSSFLGRIIGCLWQIGSTGVHASCGADSHLVVFGKGIDTMDWEDSGQEAGTTMLWQSSTLILKH